jgi:uncharacterized membrane protein YidH (DUF202 family)
MTPEAAPPAFVIGLGIAFIAVGLWPKWGNASVQVRGLGEVKPVIARLLFIGIGLVILILSFAIVRPLAVLIGQTTDQLPRFLNDAVGPVGVTIIGLALVIFILAVLRYRRIRK